VRLAKTAEEVTLFAGQFNPAGGPPETAILTAFNAAGAFLAVDGPVAIDGNFTTKLSVKHTTAVGGVQVGDIASFKVVASTQTAGFGADLGIDDVTANLAAGARQDFSVYTTGEVVPVIQGQSVDVPVQLPRVNGSSGPIGLSVSGLPDGVSAHRQPHRRGHARQSHRRHDHRHSRRSERRARTPQHHSQRPGRDELRAQRQRHIGRQPAGKRQGPDRSAGLRTGRPAAQGQPRHRLQPEHRPEPA
jgi:hypothetical protein